MTFLEIFKLFFSKEFVEDMSDQDQPLCRTIHKMIGDGKSSNQGLHCGMEPSEGEYDLLCVC
jgi:hypothetical protein